ncbi:MAG: hypothetical protein AB1490_03980 [Pseudomonadota bacterium]
MSYQIYFPFKLVENREIKDLPAEGILDGYRATLESNPPFYALSVFGIETLNIAQEIFTQLVTAFYWMATESGLSLETVRELQQVHEPPDPVQTAERFGLQRNRVDVVIDGGRPAIIEEGKIVVKMTGQPVSFRMGYAPKRIFDALGHGIALKSPNAKIRSAIDLYCFAQFFSERAARFLLLWSVVEFLAPKAQAIPLAEAHVDRLVEITREVAASTQGDNKKILNELIPRLGGLKTQSHTSRVRHYVDSILAKDGVSSHRELADEVASLYRTRGQLTHDGNIEIADALARIEEIIRLVLKAAIRHQA